MGSGGRKIDEAGRHNSLGLTPTKLETLLDKLEKESGSCSIRRDDARWPFRQSSIGVTVIHPGGSQVEIQMACRNLSRGGAGLLHSTFMYNGTRCVCTLPHPEQGPVVVEGEVVRCQHREGMIHEIGIKFDKEIDLRAFVNPNPLTQLFAAERVDPAQLTGSLLHLDPNEHDRNLLKHYLKDTNVRVTTALTAASAIETAHNGVDLIISEFALEDMPGSEFVVRLRSENISTPLLFLTHDISERVTNAVKRRMAQAMIRKPLTEETLLSAIAEFLHPGTHGHVAAQREISPELVESMKPELARCARQIENAVRNNKPIEALGSCHVLQQIAGVIGMIRLGEDVANVLGRLSGSMQIGPVSEDLRLIVEQCRNAA